MRKVLFFLSILCCSSYLDAQLLNNIFTENTSLDSLQDQTLRLDIDAVGFFHDNEYQSKLQDGYSLPGVRITPHLAYKPISPINIELGASMLIFNGTNRYPNFAYHDISTWKGNQYQKGAHVLPWVRLQASLKHLDVVVGNIYGGANHNCITPLYNPEQNLSADPETGIQILLARPHIKLDTWLNWQSYIFKTDTHQEAFTVGTTAKIMWGRQSSSQYPTTMLKKGITIYTPIQLLVQHRGGEQDDTNFGVQTLCNASAGVGMSWTPKTPTGQKRNKAFNNLDAQLNAMASYQQAGQLWPFNTGFAWHMGVSSHWFSHLSISADYQHSPKQFITLYGNPFFSTVSLKNGGTHIEPDGTLKGQYEHQYNGMHHIRLGIDYQYTFAKAYTLGAAAELFSLHGRNDKGTSSNPADMTSAKLHEFSFSFGLYLRVSPSIILKKF
ncbi:MAG: hypothetical protein KBT39_04870 [Bacteroidales bacterium]|nr:hypothetical protein [Bacteroidales bacterium]